MIRARLGDIIAVRGAGWLSRGILAATGYDGHDGIASHVGVITSTAGQDASLGDANSILHCNMTEAVRRRPPPKMKVRRVRTVPLFTSVAGVEAAWLISFSSLSDDQRKIIVDTALSFSNDSYGYYEIVLQLADALFHSRWFTDELSFAIRRHPICSFLVTYAYEHAGMNFAEPAQSVTPADIVRWADAHPDVATRQLIYGAVESFSMVTKA